MVLKLHNTLSRTKEDFVPIDPQNVRMYVCGPTVYDYAHIGNARPMIVFDVLYRLLRHLYPGPGSAIDGSRVTYARNITDVDDKINARAAEEHPDLPLNEAIRRVTERTEAQFHADVDALGCLRPTVEPRATEHIDDMKAMIEALIAKGFAYVAEDNVLFHVAAMHDYGRLSNRTLDEMIAGARVDVAPYKKDPTDFVLWKPSKPGEPGWPSPAGIVPPGRPGWHLECSAMSDRWLWQAAKGGLSAAGLAHPHQFDIHGGGIDLVFPHHENEIAQSRCAHGTPVMANYWLHNGFLQVEGEKMSKSLGNFVTIHELLETEKFGGRKWPGDVLRLAMLRTNYREPIDWTVNQLFETEALMRSLRAAVAKHINVRSPGVPDPELIAALCEDINTHAAIAHLQHLSKAAISDTSKGEALYDSLFFLGLTPNTIFDQEKYIELIDDYDRSPIADMDMRYIVTLGGVFNQSSNTVSTSSEVITSTTVFGGGDRLKAAAQEWTKYASPDLRLSDALTISEKVPASTINKLVEARAAARQAKNFAEADRIRAELDQMGIALKDTRDPATGQLVTTWEVKR